MHAVIEKIRSIVDLDEPDAVFDRAVLTRGSRIVWVDRSRLTRDFFGGSAQPPDLMQWLLESASVMSLHQTVHALCPPLQPDTARTVVRPPRYGRALLSPVAPHRDLAQDCSRFLDVKGAGVIPGVTPILDRRHNGLMLLPDAFEELLTQKVLEALLLRYYPEAKIAGIPVYAIGLYDLEAPVPDGRSIPAAFLVRGAHRRLPSNHDFGARGSEQHRVSTRIEVMLRSVGFTSASAQTALNLSCLDGQARAEIGGSVLALPPNVIEAIVAEHELDLPITFDRANVQMTRAFGLSPFRAQLVDFGQYEYREQFDRPLLTLVSDRVLNWGGYLEVTEMPDVRGHAQAVFDATFSYRPKENASSDWYWNAEEPTTSGLAAFAHALALKSGRDGAGLKTIVDLIDGYLGALDSLLS